MHTYIYYYHNKNFLGHAPSNKFISTMYYLHIIFLLFVTALLILEILSLPICIKIS